MDRETQAIEYAVSACSLNKFLVRCSVEWNRSLRKLWREQLTAANRAEFAAQRLVTIRHLERLRDELERVECHAWCQDVITLIKPHLPAGGEGMLTGVASEAYRWLTDCDWLCIQQPEAERVRFPSGGLQLDRLVNRVVFLLLRATEAAHNEQDYQAFWKAGKCLQEIGQATDSEIEEWLSAFQMHLAVANAEDFLSESLPTGEFELLMNHLSSGEVTDVSLDCVDTSNPTTSDDLSGWKSTTELLDRYTKRDGGELDQSHIVRTLTKLMTDKGVIEHSKRIIDGIAWFKVDAADALVRKKGRWKIVLEK